MPAGKGKTPNGQEAQSKNSETWISESQKVNSFEAAYILKDELGRGATSVVKKCVQVGTERPFAVKVIKKSVDQKVVRSEVAILLRLNHPNVIKLHEIFESETELFLVLELVTGGELFERIVAKGSYTERDAASVVRQICDAVAFLHDNDIVHRDLKPENLLYANMDEDAPLKLADFGLSKICSQDVNMKTVCGTPGYCAPEVLYGKTYGPEVDMWSIGVITYILLCGFEPFYDERGDSYVYRKILKADYEFISPWWDPVSLSARDFINKLLIADPRKRLTAKQALSHPWVRAEFSGANISHMLHTQEKIKEFNARRKLKAAGKAVIAMNRLGEWVTPVRPRKPPSTPEQPASTLEGASPAASAAPAAQAAAE
ncbi:Calcium/calmodulin-dependent protein kinase type IV [Holothuria leucospilota]|uniref:Calcium/calmodulin-dependent protein kinase type IV n=1 Tax=Holothuria leucospilota TaxID=206669 RepID=A0A9Q1BMN2_HOLLE|nr:Calcium/calmodulin-dependent protein kinase type IV [Holothuria leucospilota]